MITDRDAFPKYSDTYDIILEECSLHKEGIKRADLVKNVYDKYYSDYDLSIKSGDQNSRPLIFDRIGWGITYLFMGKFIEKCGYATYKSTSKGLSYVGKKHLGRKEMENDEDFINSEMMQKVNSKNKKEDITHKQEESPQDMFNRAYREIEGPKKKDLLLHLRDIDPFVFERVVGALCEAMGYGTFLETPKSHDGGIDGIIKGDSLGFEKIYIQAKRYGEGNLVKGKEMQNFVGALAQTSARKGIFFTTSCFLDNARKTAENALRSGQEIILIDGEMLVELMFKYNVGVQTREVYEIKYIDEDFFEGFN